MEAGRRNLNFLSSLSPARSSSAGVLTGLKRFRAAMELGLTVLRFVENPWGIIGVMLGKIEDEQVTSVL